MADSFKVTFEGAAVSRYNGTGFCVIRTTRWRSGGDVQSYEVVGPSGRPLRFRTMLAARERAAKLQREHDAEQQKGVL